MFRIVRSYMMTAAGYAGMMEASKQWKETNNLDPENRIKVIVEEAVLAAVKGPSQVTKDILNIVTASKK